MVNIIYFANVKLLVIKVLFKNLGFKFVFPFECHRIGIVLVFQRFKFLLISIDDALARMNSL